MIGGWQPRETIPRDGTVVNLKLDNGYRLSAMWWFEGDGWIGGPDLDDSLVEFWKPYKMPHRRKDAA